MKKLMPLPIFFLVICFLGACKKDAQSSSTADDQLTYKPLVERLLNLAAHPTSMQDVENSGLPRLDFVTYKEAYNSFKFLDSNNQLISRIVPKASLQSGNLSTIATGIEPLDEFYYNYGFSADPQITRSISGTFGLESILLMYHMQYVLSYGPPTVTQNSPSNAIVYYSGFGTGSSQKVIVSPTSQSTNTGTISGAIQITGTVAGVPYSLFLTLKGTYNFTVPPQEYVYSTVLVTMLTVKSS